MTSAKNLKKMDDFELDMVTGGRRARKLSEKSVKEIFDAIGNGTDDIIIDAEKLGYISSA